MISLFAFISPVSSSMTAPALNPIGAELQMTSDFVKELSLSIFVLGMSSPCCTRQSATNLVQPMPSV